MKAILKFLITGIFGLIFAFLCGVGAAYLCYEHFVFPSYQGQSEGLWEIMVSVGSLIISFILGYLGIPWLLKELEEVL